MSVWMPEPMAALVAIPLIVACLLPLAGRWPNLREGVTLVGALALLAVAWPLVFAVAEGHSLAAEDLAEPLPGITLTLDVEPLGAIFVLVAATLWLLSSAYSIGYMRGNNEGRQTRFFVCFAVSISATMGIALAGNLFTLFVFYEALTLATYPLVVHHGDQESRHGGRVYLGLLLVTSIGFLLTAILWTYAAAGHGDFRAGGILAGQLEGYEVGVLLALYAFGIGKAALMPFHAWLPAAMVAPTPVSALLHAVAVVKAGVFCMTKVVVYVFGLDLIGGEPSTSWLPWVAGLSIVLASAIALRQDNLKRRLAFSTVSQLSYVTLAAALVAPYSIMAAALHIVAHAFGKITLFFAAGAIYTAAHKTNVSQLDGIGRRMPWTMGAFAVASLSMIGLPPTAGFVSKWYLLSGAGQAEANFVIAVLLLSTLLNAAYFLPVVYAAFVRTESQDAHAEHGEAPRIMVFALTATAVITLGLFFVPGVPLELAERLVASLP
ncbi:MAG: monovalent cation/H+ antiporter subunit D family protein [Pseudomonadota bacterium]